MSIMTEQDREWVKAMIQEAISNLAVEFPRNCPIISKFRFGLVCFIIGLSVPAAATGVWLAKVLKF